MTFLQHKVSLDFVDISQKKSESAQLTLMEATFSSDLHMAQNNTAVESAAVTIPLGMLQGQVVSLRPPTLMGLQYCHKN